MAHSDINLQGLDIQVSFSNNNQPTTKPLLGEDPGGLLGWNQAVGVGGGWELWPDLVQDVRQESGDCQATAGQVPAGVQGRVL